MLLFQSFLPIFIFAIVLQLTRASFYKNKNSKKTTSKEEDFDALVFSQSWPETTCFEWKQSDPSHQCVLSRNKEWYIHGIWPSKFHEEGPSFCNKTQSFNESALSPILNQLDEKWKNIHAGKPHFSFWKHEWEKHGTCASVLPDLNTELKYFQKGLDLLRKYDMTRLLAISSILPGNNYPVQEIIDGVEKILGKTVNLECTKNPKTDGSYLAEIRICLDKTFKLIDCDNIYGSLNNCDRKMPVNYPITTPRVYDGFFNTDTNEFTRLDKSEIIYTVNII